ncbi:protein stum [Prorops nasuta]|uniref:protein stum n=1 Tax=Prorops nasuta TaxID=863751 RepID=UPI0034CDF766
MRRHEEGGGGQGFREAPPFRVLVAPDARYLSASPTSGVGGMAVPPPPRAPEPYKVAPASITYARAHRRSSFVILAEANPESTGERSPSPSPSNLPTGRISPFRGKGFKPPPPRARSRNESPDNSDPGRKSDRKGSISQQNSPRRSLIPQPTRRRSVSLGKTNDRSTSPASKRVDNSKNRLSLSTTNIEASGKPGLSRRSISKSTSRLSPIQGTPTKPPNQKAAPLRRGDHFRGNSRISPGKNLRAALPPKSLSNKRSVQNQNSSRERLTSPSKIPLKAFASAKKSNSTSSLSNNNNRFISLKVPAVAKEGEGEEAKRDEKKETRKSDEDVKDDGTKSGESEKSDNSVMENVADQKSPLQASEELALLELLKKSSGATGTSSVVNTTTTTAVQPLKIDQTPKDSKSTSPVAKDEEKSSDSSATKEEAPVVQVLKQAAAPKEERTNNFQKAVSRLPKISRLKSVNDSGSPGTGSPKTASPRTVGQSTKNQVRLNGSTEQKPNKDIPDPSKSPNTKLVQAKDGISSSSSTSSLVDGTKMAESKETLEKSSSEKSESTRDVETPEVIMENIRKDLGVAGDKMAALESNLARADAMSMAAKGNSVRVDANGESLKLGTSENSEGKGLNRGNRGSNPSLRSTGVSSASLESAGSTDTGVSVDTVKGVSSPREKKGVHVVKRPQEIETLSGNVMHLEQNGEPAVLGGNSSSEQEAAEKLWSRWRRSVGGCCKCPDMRCLACRRDPKGILWPKRNQPKPQMQAATVTPAAAAVPDAPVPSGSWSKFRSSFRLPESIGCTRLKDLKCCKRRGRVAPAETQTCCPPERRFGALCRRIFATCGSCDPCRSCRSCRSCNPCKCCKYKGRSNDSQRRKSIRAKHSLTSVAPPPLSEEPRAKIPDVLVEHNSMMRAAIPCLPLPLAWFCLLWNVLLPGSGTFWSGLFNLCVGQPRFSSVATFKSRLGAFIVNLIVGVGQLFTVLFCLVGWGWSIWWGITMIKLARKYKRFKDSEAASGDPEARAGEAALPPGVPSNAMREMERAR